MPLLLNSSSKPLIFSHFHSGLFGNRYDFKATQNAFDIALSSAAKELKKRRVLAILSRPGPEQGKTLRAAIAAGKTPTIMQTI